MKYMKMKHKQKNKRRTNDDLPDAEFSGCLSGLRLQ